MLKKSKGAFLTRKGPYAVNKSLVMTEDEIVEIVKESNLWESLTQTEKEEAISHALKITRTETTDETE